MLKFFTRLEKTRNFVLFLFAILMVGSLVFFYTPARNDATVANLAQSTETVASVSFAVYTHLLFGWTQKWRGPAPELSCA